ncbi:MAG: energy transducer TonB [Rhodospirillaceae bacterium]
MTFRTWHWGIAATLAIGLHSAVVIAAFWQEPDPGARAVGATGLEISLGAAGGAPGGSESVAPDDAKDERPAEAKLTEVEPAPVEPAAVPEAVPVETAQAAEPEEVPEETPVEAITRVVKTPVPARKPPEPRREKPKPPEAKPVEAEPAPKTPVMQTALLPEQAEPASRPAPNIAGASGKAGTQASPDVGSNEHKSGGGMPGAPPDYISILRAWLDRHKEYPRPARVRREEGTAYLYFVIDREGKVLEFSLRKSSGHGSLDRATVEMIKRASPLPEIPDSMSVARLELVIPVQFQLR